uniref:RNA-directed DNA polymerase n=1 Tax=Nettle badnavirus 1 TaxID=3158948 RepID=A0AAU7GJ24_9VIRU
MATRTMTHQLPRATEGSSNTETVEDQIRGYRRLQRARHVAQRAIRRTIARDFRQSLEQQIDPDRELSLSRRRRANLVPAEVLYSHNNNEPSNRVYQHYEELRSRIIDNQQDLRYIERESYDTLRRSGMQHIHIGMMMLRLQLLHRVDSGVSAVVVFRDTRWTDERQILSAMTMDLARGTQMVYTIPDILISIHDFYNHIQVCVQTRGYGPGWTGGDSNLIITRSLIGRITNTSQANFNYQIEGVSEYLTSQGVQAVPGEPWRAVNRENQWTLAPSTIEPPIQNPTGMIARRGETGNVSIRFTDFQDTQQPLPEEDEEERRPERTHVALVGTHSWEPPRKGKWDTLGQPSGKYDYLVDYSAPKKIPPWPTTCTGWGEEFEEEDKETQEEPYQKYQKFEEEMYYPVRKQELVEGWLDQLGESASEAQYDETSSEEEGLTQEEEDTRSEVSAQALAGELDYPTRAAATIKALEVMERAYPGASEIQSDQTSTFIPPNPSTGQVRYLPANTTILEGGPSTTNPLEGSRKPGKYGRSPAPWSLPSAQQTQGAILVLPAEIPSHADAIATWETITLNLLRETTFDSLQDKADYIENLLGVREKEIWITWRMAYPEEYKTMVQVADEPRNITSAIKRVMGIQDPFTGNLHAQNAAYADLERLQCPTLEHVMPFLNRYYQLAAQSGKMWAGPELSDKLFRKLPPEIGPTIQKEYSQAYPGLTTGVMARVQFISEYLQNLCKQAELQRKLKNLNFCRTIPIPGYYETGSGKKKFGIRKARTYRGKPHDSHVKVFKNKYKGTRMREGSKCKCYLCGVEGHYARECPKKHVKPERAAFLDGLNLDNGWDVISIDPGEPDDDDICSISEGEAQSMEDLAAFKTQLPYEVEPQYDNLFALVVVANPAPIRQGEGSWRVSLPVPKEMEDCQHEWDDMTIVQQEACHKCKDPTIIGRKATCTKCGLNICPLCAALDYAIRIIPPKEDRRDWQYKNKDQLIKCLYEHNSFLLQQNESLQDEVNKRDFPEIPFFEGGEDAIFEPEKEEMKGGTIKGPFPSEITFKEQDEDARYETQEISGAGALEEAVEEIDRAYTEMPAGGNNKLYHIVVTFKIPSTTGTHPLEFEVNAIIDTGCTCCCINIDKVPTEALEEAKIIQNISGINSTTRVTKRLRQGKMVIAGNEFYTPYISAFQMNMPKIDMLVGCNFIRAMKGGLRFEGTEITFYKTVTKIQTTLEPQRIAYLEELIMEEELKEEIAANASEFESLANRIKNSKLLRELEEQGFIGEDPVKHWARNEIKCQLEIINPDITIEDKPPGDLTVEEKARYQRHIDALLKLGVIRPSKSRHRTAAFIVRSGTTIDPITGKETKGKERMVFNYKRLNDNTHKDQYSLPGIGAIIKSLGEATIFSKFDLKSGFHQVAMDEESIPWTAFISPAGLYEWLVMPFGLKNAPAVFQRKMDNCFRGTESFIAVYIDDILVFSRTIKEHEEHLKVMLEICKRNGLVLSPSKMKIACKEVEFLGATIREGRIKLQEHVIKKIADVEEKSLTSLKGLRSWLGVINYARAYIPRCGTLLGPLYSKTSEHGERRWKSADWKIVREIKELVRNLPDLEIPPKQAYMVLETDGCMEGWGGVCKWKEAKAASQGSEKICAYASGKFPVPKSTIDAEIFAVTESLEKFKLFYLDKREITLRTDCQAIISFYEKMAVKKPSRVRWIKFCDYITNTGVTVNFEHIKGNNNQIADQLSRLAQNIAAVQAIPEGAHNALALISEGKFSHIGLMAQLNRVLKQEAQSGKQPTWYERPHQKKTSLGREKKNHTKEDDHHYKNQQIIGVATHKIMASPSGSQNTTTQEISAMQAHIKAYKEQFNTEREKMIKGLPFRERQAIGRNIMRIEQNAGETLKAVMKQYLDLVKEKEERFRDCSTKDNYWGDLLPYLSQLTKELEATMEHVSATLQAIEGLKY